MPAALSGLMRRVANDITENSSTSERSHAQPFIIAKSQACPMTTTLGVTEADVHLVGDLSSTGRQKVGYSGRVMTTAPRKSPTL
jgi:hypothetical protein